MNGGGNGDGRVYVQNIEGRLSDRQLAVIAAMVAGKTQRAAADEVGVAEQTVSTWVRHDALFAAQLNRARSEVWAGRVAGVRDLADAALEALACILRNGESEAVRARVALAILDRCGLGEVGRPSVGPTTADAVRGEWARTRANAYQYGGLIDDLLNAGDPDALDRAMSEVLEAEREARVLTE